MFRTGGFIFRKKAILFKIISYGFYNLTLLYVYIYIKILTTVFHVHIDIFIKVQISYTLIFQHVQHTVPYLYVQLSS